MANHYPYSRSDVKKAVKKLRRSYRTLPKNYAPYAQAREELEELLAWCRNQRLIEIQDDVMYLRGQMRILMDERKPPGEKPWDAGIDSADTGEANTQVND